MSGRMHSRSWDRGSPGRRRPSGERGKIDHFHKRDSGSPDRSKRGRWESPSKNRMGSPVRMRRRDLESPPRASRKDVISPSKSRRGGLDDGPRPSFGEQHRSEEEYRFHAMHPDGHREAPGSTGIVFLCNSSTLRECFHFRVLGLPAAQREVVERIVPGTKLFLFNFDTKELFGVFEAASRGGLNLVPEAFLDSKGTYAAQVRFNIFRECLPLADDIVRDVLRENFSQRGKFDCELSVDQVFKIMQLFSHQELRPGIPGQEREKHDHDSRVNALDLDGRRFPSSLQGSRVLENNVFQESQLLMSKAHAEGTNPDPAVILGQSRIEEVDQLALKYLQNNPRFAGIRLEPVNTSLLSTTLRNNPQSSFSNPSMNHEPVPIGGNFGAVNLQPNGVPFPAVGSGIPNPGLLGHPGSSAPDMEHSGAEGGKLMGHFMPGSLGSDRGLLPIPGMHHHMGMPLPNQPGFPLQPGQPGMIPPFPPGAAVPGSFPMGAGPLGGPRPEFGGPFSPFQGPHRIPTHQMVNRPNNRQEANLKVAKKPNRNKQKNRGKGKKVLKSNNAGKQEDDASKEADSPAE